MDSQSRAEEFPHYQLKETPEYEKQFEKLVRDPRVRDELQREFSLELPQNPERFYKIPGTKLRFANVGTPPLTVFFFVKNRVITLVEIHPFQL
jgi:hypothetical protein